MKKKFRAENVRVGFVIGCIALMIIVVRIQMLEIHFLLKLALSLAAAGAAVGVYALFHKKWTK